MMSSKRGGGRSNRGGGQSNRGDGNMPASKGKYIAGGSRYDDDRLNQAVRYVNVDGNWEVISRKNKYRPGNGAPSKQWAAQTPKPSGGRDNGQARAPNNTWAAQSGDRCSDGNINYTYNPAPNAIPSPLHSGWNWNDRPANAWQLGNNIPEDVEDQNETGDVNESDDDDEFLTDESDSDKTPKTHDERKKNKWYADLFKTLEGLTLEEINEPRTYHCPACQNSPESIHWYRTLPSLLTHAKTKESKRVKIHRNLAVILEEELQTRGANIVASRESYGQWKGLNESVKDKEIVWPPMVVIRNTQLKMDKNETWIGMGNDELLHYFKDYAAVRARQLYGLKGHRGMSILIFESCAVGYGEAERLSKHFEHEGSDRDAWDHRPNLFYPGGKRQLYGYMATKKDMDFFNRHSHEKMKLGFELVSYQEKVVNQLKQMNEDNQQLNWYKNKILKEKRRSKALEESFDLVSQKLRKTEEEKRIVRERTQRYHEQNKEEMDYQEQFFKDQLKIIQDARNANEGHFDKLQEEERIRVEKSYSVVDPQKRDEKLEEMKGFEEEREKLMKRHEEKKAEMKSRHWKEEIELEEGFDAELTQLMEKYTPKDQVQNA